MPTDLELAMQAGGRIVEETDLQKALKIGGKITTEIAPPSPEPLQPQRSMRGITGEWKESTPWGEVGKEALATFPESLYRDIAVPLGKTVKMAAKGLLPEVKRQLLGGPLPKTPTLSGMGNVLSAVWEDLKKSYGSEEAIKETIAKHPARVLNDISTLALGVGGVAKQTGLTTVGKVATKVGQIAEPISVATAPFKVAGKALATLPIVPKAERLYLSALKPATKTPIEARNLAKYGLDKKLSIRYGSWMKMEDQISQLGKKIDDIITSGTAKGDFVDLADITKHYDYIRNNHVPFVSNPKTVLRQVDNAEKAFVDYHMARSGGYLKPSHIQKMKRTQQEVMKKLYGEMNKTTKSALSKGLAYDSRVALEKLYPELKPINIPLGEMIEFNKHMGNVVKVHEKADFVRNIAFMIKAVSDQPYLKSKVAIWLNKAQKGHPLANPRALEKNLMMQLGRVTEQQENQLGDQ